MTEQPTPDQPAPLSGPFTVVPAPKDSQSLRDRYAEALTAAAHQCDGDCGLSERDCYDAHPITWSAMAGGTTHVDGSVVAIADTVLAVRDEEMARLRAELDTCRERYAVSASNAMQELAAKDAELVAARSTLDRVRAAADMLATQAADFTGHHNPACECSWGEALDQAATRIRAALDPPQPTTPPTHLAKGTNAEDCPACRTGQPPDYPWVCPGPEAAP